MEKVLLQLASKNERRRIEDILGNSYHIQLPDPERPLQGELDLAIIDGASLKENRQKVEARRRDEEPVLLPFLLLSTRRPGSLPVKYLGDVVDDLILRPIEPPELQARVANLLRMRRLSLDVKKEHDRVMKLAVTDDVTGFNNTRYLHRFLDRFFDNAATRPSEACLVFFDLDNFKRLVDVHGHLLGSKALKEVAQVVSEVMEEEDRLVRYGGDEFIVLLPRQSKDQGLLKVERFKEAINNAEFLRKEGVNARLTASFGLASYPRDAGDKKSLLAAADRCLFQSKSDGKNRVSVQGEGA